MKIRLSIEGTPLAATLDDTAAAAARKWATPVRLAPGWRRTRHLLYDAPLPIG